MAFDITDARNRYKPCPSCLRDYGMGLVYRCGTRAVECDCGFRGPNVPALVASSETDRSAFEAWNALPR